MSLSLLLERITLISLEVRSLAGFKANYIQIEDFFFGYIQIQDKQEAKGLFILNLDKINFKLLHEIKMCIQINML